jgi:hypothetical protein
MAEPMAHRSMDLGPTKYDDVGYHAGPAEEAGQPREYAFTHIGLYLAWLIRHDLHDPRGFPPEHIEAVKRGEMTGSDLADDIDWKLLSDSMTSEGAAFSDARYGAISASWPRCSPTNPTTACPMTPRATRGSSR